MPFIRSKTLAYFIFNLSYIDIMFWKIAATLRDIKLGTENFVLQMKMKTKSC